MDRTDVALLREIMDCSDAAPALTDALLVKRASAIRLTVLKGIEACPERAHLFEAFNRLPEAHRIRVLISTEMGDWLSDYCNASSPNTTQAQKQNAGPMLLDMLEREWLLSRLLAGEVLQASTEEPGRLWSPLGDLGASVEDGRWRLFHSPTVGGICAVDFDSPSAKTFDPRSGVLSQDPVDWLENEKDAVVAKLNAAMSEIDAAVPAYGALIRNFVRRIMVRKSVHADEKSREIRRATGSEHVIRQPGGIRLLNPHLPEMTVAQCMETILHESVHNVVAAWETVYGHLPNEGALYRPVSPWTGNPIPNSSFVHAIFVYYSCYRLFRSALDSQTPVGDRDRKYIEGRLPYFAAGFLVDRPFSTFIALSKRLDPLITQQLDELQESMRALYPSDPATRAAAA